jgi:hypothetical protein
MNLTPAQERSDYIALVLEDEFLEHFLAFSRAGILGFEVLNLVSICGSLLDEFDFENHEDGRMMRYAVIAAMHDYLEGGGDGL